ncbi:hemerythrin domain-containing protein [Sphingobium sp. H39-3-25]|uniref:hemerythrin domain-containing protein n=1 Tax=Sphingobium arseniciresistens TaxID=3030834 RepID=UPI0023B90A5F|nr:hemerythrin domain-containing protein [Sphingobium arseniciresistens]
MNRDLVADHDALRRMMREYAAMLDAGKPESMHDLSRQRIAFSQRFRAHMAAEYELVTAWSEVDASARVAQVTRTFSEGIRRIFMDYSQHIKDWTPDRIGADWAGYRRAVLGLQRQLADHMAWEERELHPVAVPVVSTPETFRKAS